MTNAPRNVVSHQAQELRPVVTLYLQSTPQIAYPIMQPTPRLRGRRAVEQRRRRLAAEPLCRRCKERGIVTAATVPDHIKPLALGGSDADDNIRCLCQACHDEVTAEQFGHRKRVAIGTDGWPIDREAVKSENIQ